MANSILKLKVESEEYNAKLKEAAKGLQHLAEVAHRGAGEMTGLDKSEIEFIKSLGDMETKSRSAAGSVRELEKTYKDLALIYKNLSDIEKEDEGGKALAASLERLKERLMEGKAQMAEVNKELNGGGGLKDALDAVAGKFGLSIDQVTKFGGVLAVTGTAVKVAKDAFFASEATVDEWGRTVASAESVYEGFLNALNNMDISGFLSRIDEIVSAARAAYNELDRLGTMKTIQAPQISAQQTENDRIRMMIQTGRYIGSLDGRKEIDRETGKVMQNGQQLNERQIKVLEQRLTEGTQKVVDLVSNEVKQTTAAIDAVYKRQGAELGMSVKEFRKGTSSMAEFEKRLAGAEKYNQYESQHTNTVYNPATGGWSQKRDNTANPYEQYKGWDVFRVDGDRYKQLVQLIQQRDQQAAQAYSMQSQAYRAINRAEGTTVRDIMNGNTGGKGGSTSGKGGTTPADDIAKAEANYAATMDMAQRDLMENVITQKKYDETIFKGQQDLANAYNKAYEATGDEKYLKTYQETAAHVTEMQGVIDSNIEAQKAAEKAARELEQAQKRLADAQNELAEAQATGDLKKIYAAEKKVETAQVQVDARTGSGAGDAIAVPITISNLDALKQHLTEEMATTPVGDSLLQNMQEAFSDASAIGTIFSTAVKNGIDTASFDTSGIMKKLLNNEDIDDDIITSYAEQLNEQLKMKFDETEWPNVLITFNAETKQIENAAKKQLDDAKKTQQAWGLAAQSVNNLSTALANIEDPGAKAMGTVIKAIADISLGFAQASVQASSLGPWGWLAWLAAGTAAMATTISTVHSLTGFAEGGIVPGNSFSGDNLHTADYGINAGELILNKTQQSTLASQLVRDEESVGGGTPYVTGEAIVLGANNHLRSVGKGEIVTTSFLRDKGLI